MCESDLYSGDTCQDYLYSEEAVARDKATLLAFKSGRHITTSWDAATQPCGRGWDSESDGWFGVQCDMEGGRVVSVSSMTPRGDTSWCDLSSSIEVLGNLTSLVALSLKLCESVYGNVASIIGLHQLTDLALYGTSVYGDPALIRVAIPGLSDWGVNINSDRRVATHDYSACNTCLEGCRQETCGCDVPQARAGHGPCADRVGVDECACCTDTSMVRDQATGMCTGLGTFV